MRRTTTQQQQEQQQQQYYDVVVIGAGAAGMTATYELVNKNANGDHNSNYRVLLLEASNRIGGRLKKAPKDIFSPTIDYPIDLGGEWIQYMCVCVCVCVHSTSRT